MLYYSYIFSSFSLGRMKLKSPKYVGKIWEVGHSIKNMQDQIITPTKVYLDCLNHFIWK